MRAPGTAPGETLKIPFRTAALTAAVITSGAVLLPTNAAGALSSAQTASARRAADYVASQVGPDGTVVSSYDGAPSVGLSYRAALALAEAGHGYDAFRRALTLAAVKVDAYTLTSSGGVRAGAAGLASVVAVAGASPATSFGGRDLVARILSTQATSGELVDAGYSGALNHSIGLLGIGAAGLRTSDPRVAAATAWLQGQQCGDGGWQNNERAVTGGAMAPCTAGSEDVQTSGYAVQALLSLGVQPTGDAFAFFRAAQNASGGWGYSPGDESSGDGTGIVASALSALGVDVEGSAAAKGGNTPAAVLRQLQKPVGTSNAGAYPYQAASDGDAVYSTSDGIAGELGATLPRAAVTFDDAAAPPASTPPPAPMPPVGTLPGNPPTPQGRALTPPVHPFCATVVTPQGRLTAVPAGCAPGRPAQTPCTVFLSSSGARHARPSGCLPLAARLTPCSVVKDRRGRKSVLPQGCLPLFPPARRS